MQEIHIYFSDLYSLLPHQAEDWSYFSASLPDWKPAAAQCHGNADVWAEHNRQLSVVRGWLVSDQSCGQYFLTAHSMVWDPNQHRLLDITPPLYDRERQIMRFLRHTGTEEDFKALLPQHNQVILPR
jgi:hypothetical protein